MKKNTMMRLASFLLIAVLITTSAISGTYAKYVTSDSASDTARVAKWGVTLQAEGNLFGSSYNDEIVAYSSDNAVAVQASDASVADTTDVVAPGTQSSAPFTFSLNGTPEVAGKITVEMTTKNIYLKENTYGQMVKLAKGVVTEANYKEFAGLYYLDGTTYKVAEKFADGASGFYTLEDEVVVPAETTYYPVVFTLDGADGEEVATSGSYKEDTLKKAADAIATKLGANIPATIGAESTYTYAKGDGVTFKPNTNIATMFDLGAEKLSWVWAYETADKDWTDGADTILGLLADSATSNAVVKLSGADYVSVINNTDYCLSVMFDITINVEQTN